MRTIGPTIADELLAAIIDAAPGRVRKRLDREPNAASDWSWDHEASVWTIKAGEELVLLRGGHGNHIAKLDDVSCSCLLSPKCFHILACVTSLAIHDAASLTETVGDAGETSTTRGAKLLVSTDIEDSEKIEITAAMRQVAVASLQAIDGVMVSGARASGLVVQSSLLRSAHQARAEGLVHLSAALIRLVEGIQRLRQVDDHTDCERLRRDIVTAVDMASLLRRAQSLSRATLGFSRRSFSPASLKRLGGVIAEPIWTLSGYAGVVTHLIGDDQRLYQVVETRPGDANLIDQAYRGGVDLGGAIASAQTLSRSYINVQNLTCSPDGRLGKGSKTRWAIEPQSGPESVGRTASWERWAAPLRDQLAAVFERAMQPEWLRRGGWDLVCVRGTILGSSGRGVAFTPEGSQTRLTLGISIDHASLPFRENLQLLARCPELAVELVGRVRLDRAGWIDALSLRPLSDDLTLPDTWAGCCHLGLDQLQRHFFRHAERFASKVDRHVGSAPTTQVAGTTSQTELFPGLQRRCNAFVIGGRGAVGSIGSVTHRRDRARLVSRGQITASSMLDALAQACAEAPAVTRRNSQSQPTERFQRPLTLAAAEQYCRASRGFYEREQWMRVLH